MSDIIKCRACGKETENIKSYISKKEMTRATVCNVCAIQYGLNDEEKFFIVPYDKNKVQVRPAPTQ